MAANKFATMLHRNTNKITLILVYAFLEWVLIILLLLNSLFSYLIMKFADYFGLKRPCLWCSRLDHIFEPTKFQNSYRSLVCEAHAMEISKMGYCLNHRKLAESQDMCEDCSSSIQAELSKKFAFFPWMKQLGVLAQDCDDVEVSENGVMLLKCSCCGVSLDSKLYRPDCYLIKPSWEDLDDTQKGNMIFEQEFYEKVDQDDHFDIKVSSFMSDQCERGQKRVENREEETEDPVSNLDCKEMVADDGDKAEMVEEKEQKTVEHDKVNVAVDQEGSSNEIQPWHLEFLIDQDDCHLIPVELMENSSNVDKRTANSFEKREEENCGNEDFVMEFDKHVGTQYDMVPEDEDKSNFDEEVPLFPLHEKAEEPKLAVIEEDISFGVHVNRELVEEFEQAASENPVKDVDGYVQKCPVAAGEEAESYNKQVSEEAAPMQGDEIEAEVPLFSLHEKAEKPKLAVIESRELVEEDISFGVHVNRELVEEFEQVASENPAKDVEGYVQECPVAAGEEAEFHNKQASKEAAPMQGDEIEEEVPLFSLHEKAEEPKLAMLESRELIEEDILFGVHVNRELVKEFEQVASENPAKDVDGYVQECPVAAGEEEEFHNKQVSEEAAPMQDDEIEADVSIGTEIPDQESIDDEQPQEEARSSNLCMQEDPSTSNCSYREFDEHDEGHLGEFKTITFETTEHVVHSQSLTCLVSNDIEEDKIPDTPTSVDSLHHLHRKMLLLERKESGTEESLDGSIISDVEGGDGVLTMEKLKSALRAERKALNALYAELEEERNASAVAANQTMLMINKLQEEKAAMQMEALQYQRMMEEQSEYDQEALQILNELMIKREKENAELEKQLEVYRKKAQDFEAKERMTLLKRSKDGSTRSGTCSASCSNAEDSDGLSVDLNHEAKEADVFDNHQESSNQNTPPDAALYLEESLANFEDERLSILEQLKVLEEKLITLSDEEDEHFEDMKPIEHLYEANGNGYDEHFDYGSGANGVANGHYKEMNGKYHQEGRNIGGKAKRLLPLFDATDAESEDGIVNGHAREADYPVNKYDTDSKMVVAFEEEVDHVYERLQALEADREFLKHCITSLKKGDKGIELLQEILLHLRDLRSVELRARNMEDGAL